MTHAQNLSLEESGIWGFSSSSYHISFVGNLENIPNFPGAIPRKEEVASDMRLEKVEAMCRVWA